MECPSNSVLGRAAIRQGRVIMPVPAIGRIAASPEKSSSRGLKNEIITCERHPDWTAYRFRIQHSPEVKLLGLGKIAHPGSTRCGTAALHRIAAEFGATSISIWLRPLTLSAPVVAAPCAFRVSRTRSQGRYASAVDLRRGWRHWPGRAAPCKGEGGECECGCDVTRHASVDRCTHVPGAAPLWQRGMRF